MPTDLPTDRPIVFVNASAPTGGDGSRTAPFATLDAARVESLASGTVVAIGPGIYQTTLIVPTGVTLVGACVAQTILKPTPALSSQAVLTIISADVEVRNLQIGSAACRGVIVRGATASLTLASVVVHDTTATGIVVIDGGALTATDLVVRRTQMNDGAFGRGLSVQQGASATVTRGVFEDNHDASVFAAGVLNGAPATVYLENVSVRDTHPDALGRGRGVSTETGGQLTLVRGHVSRSAEIGARAASAGSTTSLEDTLIEHTDGYGVFASSGTVALHRAVVNGSVLCNVHAVGEEARIEGSDVILSEAQPRAGEAYCAGVCIYGGTIELARTSVERNTEVGVLLEGPTVVGRFEDLRVLYTVSRTLEWQLGRGVVAQVGARLELTRALVDHNRSAGIALVSPGTRATLTDVAVLDTYTTEGSFGYGIAAVFGSDVEGQRVLVARSHGVGLYASESGSKMRFEDVVVSDVATQTIPDESVFLTSAVGVGVYRAASITLARFEIDHSALCGAQVAFAAQLDFSDGAITDNEIGACVQIDGYDLGRLTSNVRYRNVTNLESTMLPVPEELAGLTP